MTAPQPLAASFPVFTEADWRAAVAKARRGSGGNPREEPGTLDLPLPAVSGVPQVDGRKAREPWRIIERINRGDVGDVTNQVRQAVPGGATGVEIAFSGTVHPLGGSINGDSAVGLLSGLRDELSPGVRLYVDGVRLSEVVAQSAELAAFKGTELNFSFDPMAEAAICGKSTASDVSSQPTEALAQIFDQHGIIGEIVQADGRLWHAGGASEEQELGVVLATFVAYLRLPGLAGRIGLALAADSDQFRTIAKFRAIRLLLGRLAEVTGAPLPRVRAETAWRAISARDPEMNILRATSAAFGAAIGGADAITVLPFDALRGGDRHSQRLARNTQTILAEESHLSQVTDPAAGSGAIEALTATFAETGWARFRAIEAQGGIAVAIADGSLLADVARERDRRIAEVRDRATLMVGVNAYGGPAMAEAERGLDAGRLVFRRLAESFEGQAA